MSPFEADITENPRMPLEVIAAASRRPGGDSIDVRFANKVSDISQLLTDAVKISQTAVTDTVNKTQQPHNFLPGDSVFLNTRHLPLGHSNATGHGDAVEKENGTRLSRALQQWYTGTRRHLLTLGENAFELDIPEHLRISRTRSVAEF